MICLCICWFYKFVVLILKPIAFNKWMAFHIQVEDLVAIELAYINTKHPDFGEASLVSLLSKSPSDKERKKLMFEVSHDLLFSFPHVEKLFRVQLVSYYVLQLSLNHYMIYINPSKNCVIFVNYCDNLTLSFSK